MPVPVPEDELLFRQEGRTQLPRPVADLPAVVRVVVDGGAHQRHDIGTMVRSTTSRLQGALNELRHRGGACSESHSGLRRSDCGAVETIRDLGISSRHLQAHTADVVDVRERCRDVASLGTRRERSPDLGWHKVDENLVDSFIRQERGHQRVAKVDGGIDPHRALSG